MRVWECTMASATHLAPKMRGQGVREGDKEGKARLKGWSRRLQE